MLSVAWNIKRICLRAYWQAKSVLPATFLLPSSLLSALSEISCTFRYQFHEYLNYSSYKEAVDRQGPSALLNEMPLLDQISWLFFAAGSTLVASSMWKLGILGTYLGDHFGILMRKRITSFPFNVVDHPMYYGSTLTFLSYALGSRSTAGLTITGAVALAYAIAARYEGYYHQQSFALMSNLGHSPLKYTPKRPSWQTAKNFETECYSIKASQTPLGSCFNFISNLAAASRLGIKLALIF